MKSGQTNAPASSLACKLCSHNLFIQILSFNSTVPSVDRIRQQMSTILFL